MKVAWREVAFRQVATFETARHDGSNKPFVGLEHIEPKTGRLLRDVGQTQAESTTFKFSKEHVLYGRLRPYLNKAHLPEFEGHCSTEIYPIRPHPSLDRRYLFYWLTAPSTVDAIVATCTGARMPRANLRALQHLRLPLPPLTEQKRIVACLNEAFDQIDIAMADAERTRAGAKELLFAWGEQLLARSGSEADCVTLEEALDRNWILSHLDGNHGNLYPRAEEFVAVGVPYVSANCIIGDQIDLGRAKFLTPERAESIKKGVARNGDVIFAHNGTVGPVAILQTDEPKVILSTSVTYYRCNQSRIKPEYLKHFMRSRRFVNQYEAVMQQSTRNQVPITTQRRFTFTLPPLEKQAAIAATLEAVEMEAANLAGIASAKLAALADLKQSILARAFSGELTREPLAA